MSTPLPIFDPEDPKLTAYALGELTDPAERAEVETLLQHSPAARTAMKEIQDVTQALTTEYDHERRTAVEDDPAGLAAPNVVGMAPHLRQRRPAWSRPWLAAAAVLFLVGIWASAFWLIRSRQPGAVFAVQSSLQPSRPIVHHVQMSRSEEASREVVAAATPKAPGTPEDTPVPGGNKVAISSVGQAGAGSLADASGLALNTGATPAQAMQSAQGEIQGYAGQPSAPPSLIFGANSANGGAVGTAGVPLLATNKKEAVPLVSAKRGQEYDVNGGLRGRLAAPAGTPPTIAQAAAAPMKPLRMNGTGAGMGGSGGGVPAKEMAFPGASARASSVLTPATSQPKLALMDGRHLEDAQKDLEDSKAVAAAPVNVSRDLAGNFKYPGQPALPVGPEAGSVTGGANITTSGKDFNTAAYDHLVENPFLGAKENPLSTFSIDVDTASYANVRRFIDAGSLPPPDAVRLEELINYFPYDDAPPAPESGKPFAIHLEAAACPWAPEHRLVRVGIKGREIAVDKRPASNLVFLLDVSGSMEPPERLPLIKRALSMLVEHLTGNDHVAIVVYAGNSGLVLPSTSGEHKDAILNALDHLGAGGSTNGASGITLAYQVAKENFIKGGTNRVILATDGDFNVGVTSQGDLIRLIQNEAKGGVFLSVLGVGTDNFKDSTMQKLADKGNGNYNYLDRLDEARKVLVEQMSGTLLTIAKDVKIQVEFNPAEVSSYRLVGYEKRMLRKEDFNNDKIDAGEIGAGHSVTALYEVVPAGQPTPGEAPSVDPLKYGAGPAPAVKEERAEFGTSAHELLTLKMRYKAPDADTSVRTEEEVLVDKGTPGDYAKATPDFRFVAAVATFGLVLRDSPYKGNCTLGAAVELAQEGKGADPKGYRAGFIELARKAQALKDAAGN